MSDQLFDTYFKASESWLKIQRELFQGDAPPLVAVAQGAGPAPEWARDAQKSWIGLAADVLNRHRESVDGLYKSAIHLFKQTSRVPEARSAEDSPGLSGTDGSRASPAARKPKSRTSSRSHKATRAPGRRK